MKKLATVAAIVLTGFSAACTSSAPGPNAAFNRGGSSASAGQTMWRASAQCTRTGKRGFATRRTAADAAAAAVASCIRRGGIPACCQVRELTPARA